MDARSRRIAALAALSVVPFATLAPFGCAPGKDGDVLTTRDSGGTPHDSGVSPLSDATLPEVKGFDVGDPDIGALLSDPKTCAEAAAYKSYIGCDYWPTVTSNVVWSIFDYAVVVANAGEGDAEVTVTGPGGVNKKVTVSPNSLQKIYLPWVAELKGAEPGTGTADNCPNIPRPADQPSVRVVGGAYHLVSSRPVTVYQFNALEYAPKGGPVGKDWSECPGNKYCVSALGPAGCFSYSNDASLLLPSTAMTGNYRVTGVHSFSNGSFGRINGAFMTVTATQDETTIDMKLGPKTKVLKGGVFPDLEPNTKFTFTLEKAGDVVQIFSPADGDIDPSGTLFAADKPIQVIAGEPCIFNPVDKQACDHIEQSVFPAETLGKHYVVTTPTGPNGKPVPHIVRIYGNIDGTRLTYAGKTPAGAPTTLMAGETYDIEMIADDFDVTGDQPFAVSSFSLAGTLVDPDSKDEDKKGDPSLSLIVAVEQFRQKYVFLAPDDYDVSFAVVVAEKEVTLTLDGAPVTVSPTALPGSLYVVHRIPLGPGSGGAHVLKSTKPVGLQVMGYGRYTSYQYPGGLDLKPIAPPPPR
ncbi:MAG: IgGFc-binding protein [Polyangiales bacterium]